jgi:hypothetical protein
MIVNFSGGFVDTATGLLVTTLLVGILLLVANTDRPFGELVTDESFNTGAVLLWIFVCLLRMGGIGGLTFDSTLAGVTNLLMFALGVVGAVRFADIVLLLPPGDAALLLYQ